MSSLTVHGLIQEAEIQAVVIRADGTREDLGTIAYYHRNPLKRIAWRVSRWLERST